MADARNRSAFVLFVAACAVATSGSGSGCSCYGELVLGTGGHSASSSAQTSSTGHGGGLAIGSSGSGGMGACNPPCAPDEVCSHGACVKSAMCKNDDDCENDTRCDPTTKTCVPWASQVPPYDPSCVNVISPGIFSPKVRCEFAAAPANDPFPAHVDVQGTPIVVNFHKPANAGPPSIIAAFTATVPDGYTEDKGVARVLKGTDCSLEANLGGVDLDGDGKIDWLNSPSSLAAGDLDGDGVADLVAYGADGTTLAFTLKNGVWGLLWKAPKIPGVPTQTWAGPSIYDLDNDGKPEVLREGAVISNTGVVLSAPPPNWSSYSVGVFGVVANLDQDANVELTNGEFVWEWQPAVGWVQDPGFTGAGPGHVAIADFGPYGANLPPNNPEIVSVHDDRVEVYALDGTLAMPPVAVPGLGGGGPPTVADFDGDGLPEVAVAGQAYYTIYDIDCGPNPRVGGTCTLGPCDFQGVGVPCPAQGYMAWSRATQDLSSNITGSSVFDFEADGVSEVVYADECFTRVYNGKTGDVLFSQYRSSCTWYENPVVADVDGNFRADLVVPSNKACSPNGDGIACTLNFQNGVDTQFAGLHCKKASECISGVCDSGYCRCVTGADCCGAKDDAKCLEEGFTCAPPPNGTPGNGDTCRASHPHGVSGIRVYSDANDKWVRSRTIWNQHAYSVTHVNEDGTVPATAAWKNNWDDPTLNNFRENVPGDTNGMATGDATAGPNDQFTCSGTTVDLSAPVCNRGADPIAAGLSVGFYVNGKSVCETKTSMTLLPGDCEIVACTWDAPPGSDGSAVDVTVHPNDDGKYAECKEGNNLGTIHHVFCKPPS